MIKVYKLSWAGLKMHVASFNTYKEAKEFINNHKEYSLIIE
jgi:hypothetical protein